MRRDSLRTLGQVREQRVDECASRLAEAVQAVDQARIGRQARERARERERQHNGAILREESLRLHTGYARAADLAQGAEFAEGARFRERELEDQLRTAEERERSARRAEDDARKDLEEAEAARVALERFSERKKSTERKRSERKADEDQVDGFNLRQRKAGR